MSEDQKVPNQEEVIAYYQEKLEKNGFTAQGMDWKDEASQSLRFEIINKYIDFKDSPSILDVGCGAGAYFRYTKERGKKFDYTGLDIVPEMLQHIESSYPEVNTLQGDVRALEGQYDYVIASGTFNASIGTDMDEWASYVRESIAHMFKLARVAVVMNLMSPHVDYTYERLYYPDMMDLTSFLVSTCGRDFIIDHDYPLYEMTLKISKT